MSYSDEKCDIDNFEPRAKRVTDSINCVEFAAASADVDLEQPPLPPTPGPGPRQELDWCVFLFGDRSTHGA